MKQKVHSYKSWIEISERALLNNLGVFQTFVGRNTEVLCVLKANAYGHGLKEVATILRNHTWFGVDSVDEACIVKTINPKASVLVMGYIPLSRLKEVITNEISFVVYTMETLEKVRELDLKKKAKIHIKIETGLNRQGVSGEKLIELLHSIHESKKHFYVEGILTHFAEVRDDLNSDFTKRQLKFFRNSISTVEMHGIIPPFIHCAATGSLALYHESHFTLVRLGIGLYGFYPSNEIAKKTAGKIPALMPVLSWKSIVAQIKEVQIGESVGYGRTWTAERLSKIAVVPVGYADGYDRRLSNNGRVLVHDQPVPVIGRVSMNMLTIDVTDVPQVHVEDTVILIGEDGSNNITVDELAERMGTIQHEVLARINPNIPRVVVP